MSTRSRFMRHLATALLYAGTACALTWPLALNMTEALPLGASGCATVPLFNLWTIWWNAEQARAGWPHYWNAPIFHPVSGTFAFSEPQPFTVVVAPLLWITNSRAFAYNAYLLGSLTLNGVFAERLLRRMRIQGAATLLGGLLVVSLPVIHWQLDVLQLIPLWSYLWFWTAVADTGEEPTPAKGLETGIAYIICCLICLHQILLLTLLIPATAWLLIWKVCRHRLATSLGIALFVICVGIIPLVWPMHTILSQHNFHRQRELVQDLSLQLSDYSAVRWPRLLEFGIPSQRPYWRVSPGWIKVGLAVLGFIIGLQRPLSRRWTLFLILTAIASIILSLGPNLQLGSWTPWWTLMEFVPGLKHVRSVHRFVFFSHLSIALLAAQGLHGLFQRTANLHLSLCEIRIAQGVIWLIAGLALYEAAPPLPKLATIPEAGKNYGWIDYIQHHLKPHMGAVCLPFGAGEHVEEYELTTRWMYLGTVHKVPLANGYSGFFPESHFETAQLLDQRFPAIAQLEHLSKSRIQFLVFRRSYCSPGQILTANLHPYRLSLVYTDSTGMDVYQLEDLQKL